MNPTFKHNMPRAALLLVFAWVVLCATTWADEPADPFAPAEREVFSGFNVRQRTFGGQQFWADELVFRGWRIQRSVLTSHYRLLDNRDVRVAWGDWDACLAKLAAEKESRDLQPVSGKVVVLVHGLARSRKFMLPIKRDLQEHSDYETISVDYPSTRQGIDAHAKGLASVMNHLDDEITEINFVAHSLGNLVVRHYLADATQDGKRLDPRIKRFVMLGPPNQGAALARLFKNRRLFHFVVRGTGKQLSTDFDELAAHLGTPPCEFGILAGGMGNESGYNPLIEGDDDLLVRVEETKLLGARDFRQLKLRHTMLARDEVPLAMMRKFLEQGHFSSEDERKPIQAE